jgi:subtilisin family serine protease
VRRVTGALVLVGALVAFPAAAYQRPSPRPARAFTAAKRSLRPHLGEWAPGRVLVEWRRGVGRARAAAWLTRRSARLSRTIPGARTDVVRLGGRHDVLSAVARFEASPLVRDASPDYLVRPTDVPSDDLFSGQWGLRNTGQPHPISGGGSRRGTRDADVDATEAWGKARGSPRTVIAVVDSGVDIDHPDLAPNIWDNPSDPEGGGDNDNNGRVDDTHGWDFAEGDASLLEPDQGIAGAEHGTHVAGIAAAANNGMGIVGACPRCSIMVLKFMRPADTDGDGAPDTMEGRISWELAALAYARRHGADVVNASFGGPDWVAPERRAFARLGRAGALAVVAAGNENGDNDLYLDLDFDGDGFPDSVSPSYPASYDLRSILSVAASNDRDEYAYVTACALRRNRKGWPCTFTNWGHDSVDLAAPGVDVRSTIPSPSGNPEWRTFDGTSMAAPHVAGIAGLVRSRHPRWTPRQVKNALMRSVDKPGSFSVLRAIPGRKVTRGGVTRTGGRLNARRALAVNPGNRYPRTDGNVSGARKLRRTARGRLRWPRDTNDVYRKRLRRGRTYVASLSGPSGHDFDLVGYRPGTKEIWQIEAGCFRAGGACKLEFLRATKGPDERARFRATRGGVYYFQVSSFFGRGRYRIRIARRSAGARAS